MLIAASLCTAKPHYVDFVNGSDAATGGSPSDPWKHCPGDDGATAAARGAALSPKDTVYFRGGIVYSGQIALKWSGKTGAPVVYDGNSSGQWGWGRAIIDGDASRYFGFHADDAPVSWIVVDNFEIRNLRYNSAMPWGSGKGICCNACASVTIANCYVHDIGYWKNDGSIVPAGNGIKLFQATSCTVTKCEATHCGESGIWLDGAQNCLISKNTVHDYVTWGIDLSGASRLCRNNTICDNIVHDLYQYDAGFWKGSGDPPHQDFVFIRMGNGTHPTRNIVERNLFYNNCAFAEFGGTAMTFLSYADSTTIRNNVYINAHSYSTVFFGWTSTGTKFYNNTIFCPRTGAVRLETGGNNDIRNNIFICTSSGFIYDSTSDERNLVLDYNLYCMPDDNKSFAKAKPYTGWSFLAWQNRGYDVHSKLLPTASAFNFVSTAGYPLACETVDLHTHSSSPFVGAGTALGGFAEDKDRVPRPLGAAWDCGAYEFPETGGTGRRYLDVHNSIR